MAVIPRVVIDPPAASVETGAVDLLKSVSVTVAGDVTRTLAQIINALAPINGRYLRLRFGIWLPPIRALYAVKSSRIARPSAGLAVIRTVGALEFSTITPEGDLTIAGPLVGDAAAIVLWGRGVDGLCLRRRFISRRIIGDAEVTQVLVDPLTGLLSLGSTIKTSKHAVTAPDRDLAFTDALAIDVSTSLVRRRSRVRRVIFGWSIDTVVPGRIIDPVAPLATGSAVYPSESGAITPDSHVTLA